MKAFLDTSAAAKLLHVEAETTAMVEFADRRDVDLVGSILLETELRRTAIRRSLNQSDVSALLDGISLYPFEDTDFLLAGLMPGENLRSLDALHVQCALSIGADCMVTYDARMVDACDQVGLLSIQPGMA